MQGMGGMRAPFLSRIQMTGIRSLIKLMNITFVQLRVAGGGGGGRMSFVSIYMRHSHVMFVFYIILCSKDGSHRKDEDSISLQKCC